MNPLARLHEELLLRRLGARSEIVIPVKRGCDHPEQYRQGNRCKVCATIYMRKYRARKLTG